MVSRAADGDDILVKAGTYNITSQIEISGKNIRIISDDGNGTGWEDADDDLTTCIIDADYSRRIFYFNGSGGTVSVKYNIFDENTALNLSSTGTDAEYHQAAAMETRRILMELPLPQ